MRATLRREKDREKGMKGEKKGKGRKRRKTPLK